jgi:hypothetical protein
VQEEVKAAENATRLVGGRVIKSFNVNSWESTLIITIGLMRLEPGSLKHFMNGLTRTVSIKQEEVRRQRMRLALSAEG